MNCKSCLTISDIVERAGRLAGVHMALASKLCCISKVRVLGLKTLQYSTNSTTFGVATVRSFHPGFPGASVPFAGTLKGYWRRFDVKDEALSIFLYFDSPTTRGNLLFPSLKQR